MIKLLHYAGLAACIILVAACFMPWAYFNDPSIQRESARTFTGFYSYKHNYGAPGKLIVVLTAITFICMLLPKIWAKRTNIFITGFNLAYAVKSYILYTSCYSAYCPEKKIGIFIVLIANVILLAAALFPNIDIRSIENKKPV